MKKLTSWIKNTRKPKAPALPPPPPEKVIPSEKERTLSSLPANTTPWISCEVALPPVEVIVDLYLWDPAYFHAYSSGVGVRRNRLHEGAQDTQWKIFFNSNLDKEANPKILAWAPRTGGNI